MPFWIVQLLEVIVPQVVQIIVNAYMKREQTPEVQAKVQLHQAALAELTKGHLA